MSLQEKKLIRPLPIGISEFKEIIDEHCYYSDKTLLIKKLLDNAAKATLFARPRRFGKTLNMTMLRTFFEKPLDGKDTSHYFKDLEIWKKGDKYTKEQGKRPVIYITFKDIKFRNFSEAIEKIRSEVYSDLQRHPEIFTSKKINGLQKKQASDLLNSLNEITVLSESIKTISGLLYVHYGIQPMIIIDEYDTPIQTANEYGYYDDMINFMRIFLSSALKDNPYLYRGVLTGITRVSKESIFSGLNNLLVDTIFDEEFSDCFGMTKKEVSDMLDFYDVSDKKEEAADWYDGYIFGKTRIYNPWSMIQYVHSGCEARPYWINTSANGLVGQALEIIDQNDRAILESLLSGGEAERSINANIVYPDITRKSSAAYSLLVQTGYLKSTHTEWEEGKMICSLAIPNRELKTIYYDEILDRFVQDETSGLKADELRRAILRGNAEKIEQLVQDYLMSSLSFHDLTEEKDYHNVFLGLVYIATDNYTIKSNRESGEGRYDIAMFPKRKNIPGIIFELKYCKEGEAAKSDKAKLEQLLTKTAGEALKQIEDNEYLTELKESGASPIFRYGAAFCGKKAKVTRNSSK